MATTKQILGKVTVTPKGEYQTDTEYKRLDIVTFEGSSYIAKADNTNVPVTNSDTWLKLVEKPIKGTDYFTEEDIIAIVGEVTENSESAFNIFYDGMVEEFNKNSTEKTDSFNKNYDDKLEKFNTNASTKTSDFDTNATKQTDTYNTNADSKLKAYNDNHDEKVSVFDKEVETATNTFNTNATEKTNTFDSNASSKTTEFNNVVTQSTTDFNKNANNQTESFNTNAQEKTDEFNANASEIENKVNDLEDVQDTIIPKQTVTDSIININDALAYKTLDFKVDGAYKQDGEPTPDTPAPINVLNFDKVMKRGQNLFNYKDTKEVNSAYSVDEDGWITINVDNTDGSKGSYYNYYTNNILLKPNKDYNVILEVKEVSGNANMSIVSYWNPSQGQFQTSWAMDFEDMKAGKVYNKICKTNSYLSPITVSLRTFCTFNSGTSGKLTFRLSVIEDTTVTPEAFVYQPYKATDYVIDLQSNEVVGLENGITDKLQIDRQGNINLVKNIGKVILNGVDDYWWADDSGKGFFSNKLIGKFGSEYLLCDYFKPSNNYITWSGEGQCGLGTSGSLWFMPTTQGMSLDDWKAWLQENNVTVYYQLAEPQTISLGKLEDIISTDEGANTFAINGNIDTKISTTYALGLKKYIDNKIAQVSQAIVEGE